MRLKDEDKFKNIKLAVLKLVYKEGLVSLQMRAIAQEAGIGLGTLYTYFPTKEELLLSLYEEVCRQSLEATFTVYDQSKSYKDNFRIFWKNFISFKIKKAEEVYFKEVFLKSPYFTDDIAAREEENYRPFIEFIGQGQSLGLLKEAPVQLLVAMLQGHSSEIIKLFESQLLPCDEEHLEKAFQMIWDGIAVNR